MSQMPEIREADRRGLQSQARDADEHRRLCMAYRAGWHAATVAAIDAVAKTRAPKLPEYEESEN